MRTRWLALFLLGCGCPAGASAPADASVDGPNADVVTEADADGAVVKPDGGSACDDSSGLGTPSGWTPYLGYCRSCGLAVPATPIDFPSPIVWETCPAVSTVPTGAVCKQMKLDWAPQASGAAHVGIVLGASEPSGAVLFFTRLTNPALIGVIARADGPVLQAMQVNPKSGCYFEAGSSLRNGNFMFVFTRYDSPTTKVVLGGGAVGGSLLAPPAPHLNTIGGSSLAAAVGSSVYLDVGPRTIRRFSDDGIVDQVKVPPLSTAHHSFYGDVLLFDQFGGVTNAVGFRTPDGKTHDVANFGSDVSQGAADLVTDGTDYVWMEAFGRLTKSDPWTGARLMTAKYTTDTATLAPRRVRSWSWERFTSSSFVVGCGYAVGNIVDGIVNNVGIVGVGIVRLSDGVSWKLLGKNNTQELRWSTPLAVTCDEAFIRVDEGVETNIARIRLDSLGPGIPAD